MKSKEILRHPGTQLLATAMVPLLKTAILDHRESTHRSVETGPFVRTALEIAGSPFTDNKRWAATHRVHHSTADANLLPFIELADYLAWRQANPDLQTKLDLPDRISGLDPALPEMSFEDAVQVGELARQLVDGKYLPKQSYSSVEAVRILYSADPRYLYESPKGNKDAVKKVGDDPSLWDIRYVLRDPHSPALHPQGLRGIGMQNRHLYDDVVTFFTLNPQFMPDDLVHTKREAWIEDNKKIVRLGFVATSVVARLAIDRPRTRSELAKSTATGAVISGLATMALIAGGNIVNSLGHGGDVPFFSTDFVEDVKTGRVRVKSNGRYTANSTIASIATLDEVGGQLEHHDDPSLIAYTQKTGLAKFVDAPFGTIVEAFAKRNIGMRVGPGFEGRRPDLPSDAVLKIEELRREYIATHPTAES